MEDFPNQRATAGIVEISRGPQPMSGSRNDYTSANILRAALPAVLDVPQAARLLGIGRTLAYELVRTDQTAHACHPRGPFDQDSLCTPNRTHVDGIPNEGNGRLTSLRRVRISERQWLAAYHARQPVITPPAAVLYVAHVARPRTTTLSLRSPRR
jgi:hypothetical protein